MFNKEKGMAEKHFYYDYMKRICNYLRGHQKAV
jgi:hypothetical protein